MLGMGKDVFDSRFTILFLVLGGKGMIFIRGLGL